MSKMGKIRIDWDTNFAHRKEEQRETLKEHTEKTERYFQKICHKKEVCRGYKRFLEVYLDDLVEKEHSFLEEIFYSVPRYHDYGKINPVFQRDKMGQKINVDSEIKECLRGGHSLFSAILYLDCFLPQIKGIGDKTAMSRIRHLIFVNAYVISRHHSDFNCYLDFIYSFEEDIAGDIVEVLAEDMLGLGKMNLESEVLKKEVTKEIRWVKSGNIQKQEALYLYCYERLLYSLLVASDYYATSEFMSGVQIEDFGEMSDIKDFLKAYQEGDLYQKIKAAKGKKGEEDINQLRNEMFWETEEVLKENYSSPIFYLEAPTGSGKSNTAMNLSFRLLEKCDLQKIYYVYPFNTLVEQNIQTLTDSFGNMEKLMEQIAVINSITPIKLSGKKETSEEDNHHLYEKGLLNRQFLNYPFILTTSVSLFDTMFSDKQEKIFGFHQLMNSVIVLDEVQNLNNQIWTEIIEFFHVFADVLNLKIILMSATLPDLNKLSENAAEPVYLIKDRNHYFQHSLFRERVELDFHLLDEERDRILDCLREELIAKSEADKKILVEFIKKKTAKTFYKNVILEQENGNISVPIYLLTGDDNMYERNYVLREIKKKDKPCILIATQVVEAGVDIDMDIGYKDISILDSEEQFLGRINRSRQRNGIAYFFDYDKPQRIYKNDYRVSEEIRLPSQSMREILRTKDFGAYYDRIIETIRRNNHQYTKENIEDFYKKTVACLEHPDIAKRMRLIDANPYGVQVFFNRTIQKEDGSQLEGSQVWERYKALLRNLEMDYCRKRYELSVIRAEMSHFIYQISANVDITCDDQIGELYYIKDCENYFINGKLDTERFETLSELFI